MSVNTQKERAAIRNLYGDEWRKKVDKMPDGQVLAVYFRFKREGKIK